MTVLIGRNSHYDTRVIDIPTVGAAERAALAIGRLDGIVAGHPLRAAILYRTRLDAVRRQSAADGLAIDAWHLAAALEGLIPRMHAELSMPEAGAIFANARHALHLYNWLVSTDFDQEGLVQQAEAVIAATFGADAAPLFAGALAMHAWLDGSGDRMSMRVALIRHWVRHKLLRIPVPLTGPRALRDGTDWEPKTWVPAFLSALAAEADDYRQMVFDVERGWFTARSKLAGRRATSRAPLAIDILAASPLISATTLASALDMAPKNAIALLDQLAGEGIVVEVTHRFKRRLFGLPGLAPIREAATPPRRPMQGRRPGRPYEPRDDVAPEPLPPTATPLTPIERRAFDYSDLEFWMAKVDRASAQTETARKGEQQ